MLKGQFEAKRKMVWSESVPLNNQPSWQTTQIQLRIFDRQLNFWMQDIHYFNSELVMQLPALQDP